MPISPADAKTNPIKPNSPKIPQKHYYPELVFDLVYEIFGLSAALSCPLELLLIDNGCCLFDFLYNLSDVGRVGYIVVKAFLQQGR